MASLKASGNYHGNISMPQDYHMTSQSWSSPGTSTKPTSRSLKSLTRCGYPGCDKAYTNHQNVLRHQRRDHGRQQFEKGLYKRSELERNVDDTYNQPGFSGLDSGADDPYLCNQPGIDNSVDDAFTKREIDSVAGDVYTQLTDSGDVYEQLEIDHGDNDEKDVTNASYAL